MDNRTLTNPDEIANELNAYYINIGRSLSDQIQSQRSSHEYLGNKANTNFAFTTVNEELLIYINDLPLVSNIFKMLMYADDTTLYCNIDQNVDADTINNELAKIWEWLIANKLSLNTTRTKYMVFHTNQRNVTYPNLVINNSIIERVSHFNFLGIMLSSIT